MTALLVAAGATALAVLLALPATRRGSGLLVRRSGRPRSRALLVPASVGGAGLALVPGIAVPAVLAAATGYGVLRLVRARRADRDATATRGRVVELCEVLRAELAAGQTAGRALELAAVEWPLVAPAARAATSGGDVTAALRDLAAVPGAAALRVVAAAWQVAHRTGHGLADVLGRVAVDLRAAEQTRRIVAGELASARATARLLAALPLVALAMGGGTGAAPWQFLLGQPAGLACLAGGLALGYAGLAWVEALARDVDRLS